MLPSAGSVPEPPVGTGTAPTPKLSVSVQQTDANREAPPELPSPAGTAEPPKPCNTPIAPIPPTDTESFGFGSTDLANRDAAPAEHGPDSHLRQATLAVNFAGSQISPNRAIPAVEPVPWGTNDGYVGHANRDRSMQETAGALFSNQPSDVSRAQAACRSRPSARTLDRHRNFRLRSSRRTRTGKLRRNCRVPPDLVLGNRGLPST